MLLCYVLLYYNKLLYIVWNHHLGHVLHQALHLNFCFLTYMYLKLIPTLLGEYHGKNF